MFLKERFGIYYAKKVIKEWGGTLNERKRKEKTREADLYTV